MGEHEREQWVSGHGALRCGTTRGVRMSVGQQGRIGGGAHGSARRTCEREGLVLVCRVVVVVVGE